VYLFTYIFLFFSVQDQVMMVKQYIRVLHYLYRMNNFQSLMAVMSGTTASQPTLACSPNDTNQSRSA
jgi:uncharacterized ParB-like nuclease family protein